MSNRVKFCPKEKKIEVVEPQFVQKSFENLTIGGIESSSHFVKNCSSNGSSSCPIVLKSHYSNQREKFDPFFSEAVGEICLLSLIEKERDKIYKLIETFLAEFSSLVLAAVEDANKTVESKLCTVQRYVSDKIHQYDSSYKREKELLASERYVPPIEKAIGLKWKTKVDLRSGLPNHTIVQPTFQYVSILSTLSSLFKQPTFKKMYFDSCLNTEHTCEDSIYKHFCCSSVGRARDIFKDKTAIKICGGIDDFDPCDAVKSHKVTHKVSAFYFTIGNMSDAYSSKNDNMYLIALCDTTNLKQEKISYDDITTLITNEIKELETNGIRVDDKVLKGSFVNVTGDNLGANGFFGYIENFNGRFCRACDINKEESERATKEDPTKLRTKESYSECVNAVERFESSGKKINFQVTKGVKRGCPFNSLAFFHTIENITFDIMHDVNEGAILFLMRNLFRYMNDNKIMDDGKIQKRVRDFNYGEVSKRNKPSALSIDSNNLGQNASQSLCLFINLPFIFADIKEKLEPIWIGVESLLKCVEIIYSKEISEDDINQLEILIELHLNWFLNTFNTHLRPKHHFLTHYPDAIRRMGPLIYYWMMRVDSKHQFFTRVAKNTNNFVNLTKTMAKKHQAIMAYKPFTINDIQLSKSSNKFEKMNTKYRDHVLQLLGHGVKDDLLVHKFATFNHFQYREGLLIVDEGSIYEIVYVFSLHDKISLYCRPYRVVKFESFFNSFEIACDDSSKQFKLVDPKKLNNLKSYDKKFVQQKIYIICDTLNVRKVCSNSLHHYQ